MAERIEPRYLTAQEVCQYITCSRSQLDALVKAGRLPEPIRLTDRMIRWDRQAIDAALSSRPTLDSADAALARMADAQAAQGRSRRHKAAA